MDNLIMVQSSHWDWQIVSLEDRFDSINFIYIRTRIEKSLAAGSDHLVLDCHRLKSLSIPAIKFITYTAKYLRLRGGQLALMGAPHRLRRHIEVYGTLDDIEIFKPQRTLSWQKEREVDTAPVPLI